MLQHARASTATGHDHASMAAAAGGGGGGGGGSVRSERGGAAQPGLGRLGPGGGGGGANASGSSPPGDGGPGAGGSWPQQVCRVLARSADFVCGMAMLVWDQRHCHAGTHTHTHRGTRATPDRTRACGCRVPARLSRLHPALTRAGACRAPTAHGSRRTAIKLASTVSRFDRILLQPYLASTVS